MSSDDDAKPTSGFGQYIRAQRQLARLTLRELADLAHVSNPYLSQIERGLHQPSIVVVKALAEALGLSAKSLLSQAAGITDPAEGSAELDTRAAIRADPHLSASQKTALLAVYESMRAPADHDAAPVRRSAKPARS
jgi:transcriptional regulator with XRE-family HTH domain